ncbi:hypothetical protein CVT25_005270 [Psilocybe cyanescens]|uniref:Uncharacterized protein n=1 Tax=Psilocybe cyanescens TaxID=93625 RepID=A0A409XDS5_PSICY|nr:hypothetical protein CVT25_005270 [Psilocybe cyanescens]
MTSFQSSSLPASMSIRCCRLLDRQDSWIGQENCLISAACAVAFLLPLPPLLVPSYVAPHTECPELPEFADKEDTCDIREFVDIVDSGLKLEPEESTELG